MRYGRRHIIRGAVADQHTQTSHARVWAHGPIGAVVSILLVHAEDHLPLPLDAKLHHIHGQSDIPYDRSLVRHVKAHQNRAARRPKRR